MYVMSARFHVQLIWVALVWIAEWNEGQVRALATKFPD
jgi:hypothetical protein